jgi:hypothetical protein
MLPAVSEPEENAMVDDTRDKHDPEEHVHQIPGSTDEPGVDARTGQMEKHCSQCGALIEGSDDFCQICALEVSGGATEE